MSTTDAAQKTLLDAQPTDHPDADPRDALDRLADDTTMIPSQNMDFAVACAAADCVRVTLGRVVEVA